MWYPTILLTILGVWALDTAGILATAIPTIPALSPQLSFYVVHGLFFLGIHFSIRFLSNNQLLSESFLKKLASPIGTSRYFDWILLASVLIYGAAALGARTVSPYLALLILMMILGAGQSILYGTEPLNLRRPRSRNQNHADKNHKGGGA